MLARAQSFTIEGLRARQVAVEVDIHTGLPTFTIVGLADAAVREARDRVRAAIINSGYKFPSGRITANLAPSDTRKAGAGLDLALAAAVLAASNQIPRAGLDGLALFGELSLNGAVRPCRGTLAVAQETLQAGLGTLVLASERAGEAALVEGLRVSVAERLASAARIVRGGPPDQLRHSPGRSARAGGSVGPDLADVAGRAHAVRALMIAAAGAHNVLLVGPPGTGKTMLAQRLPSILPPLSRAEAIEVTRIHSIAGKLEGCETLLDRRPFRAPHHTATTAGLVGGAGQGWVGEVVLAHNGVLFLDELSEFPRHALEALRQPLEDGRIAIVRAQHAAVYPARFMLVAATNPCPCGYAGVAERCRCSESDRARYHRRLSGPLLDRMDLLVPMGTESSRAYGDVLGVAGSGGSPQPYTSSAQAREAVLAARERQLARYRDSGVTANAHLDVRLLREHASLEERGQAMLQAAQERGLLSTRGVHRTLRVARTAADLEGHERIGPDHLAVALALRPEAALAGIRAA